MFGTIAGVVALLIGATTVFAELQSALDRIWHTSAAGKVEGLWQLIRTRFLSFGMILAIGVLLLVSLVVSAGIAALGLLWAAVLEGWTVVLQILNFVVSAAIITVLFAVIYKYLPRAKIGWHDVWIGAAVTAVLFSIGKLLIGLYIGKREIHSGFGAAGPPVVVLLWVYYSSQIFLLGAGLRGSYAYRSASRHGAKMEPAPAASKSEGEAAASRGLPGVPATATAEVAANHSAVEPRKAPRDIPRGRNPAREQAAARDRRGRRGGVHHRMAAGCGSAAWRV
jgi:membrane protein